MVVGVLTTSYPRHADDYAGSFVGDRVRALLAEGHAVEVFAAADTRATTRSVEGALTITRIGLDPQGGEPLFYGDGGPEALERGGARAWWQALRFSTDLATAVRARLPHLDALEAHWLVPCVAVAATVAPQKPLRAFSHSGDVALLERLPAGDALARTLAARIAGADLLFVTDDLRRRFAALVGRAIGRVQHLAAPADLFPPITPASRQAARAALGLAGPTVIAVGRLVPIKGFHRLIDACAEAAAIGGQGLPLTAIIVGDGPERGALAAAARVAGVRLTLPGWVPRSNLAHWLHAADAYAQPSLALPSARREGLPVATLEALAVGLPVIASDEPGLRELDVDKNRLLLIETKNRRAFGDALIGTLSRNCVGVVTAV
ncbi:MAG TPA: glycosyltransferase family 4 protein [Polyangia bacterium]|nr:glycosyltransferase family 4 protein [Polyangia bacterium]